MMAPGRFWQWPHQIHPDYLQGHLNERKQHKRGWRWSFGGSVLTNGTALTEIFNFRFNSRPVEAISDPLKGVASPKVP